MFHFHLAELIAVSDPDDINSNTWDAFYETPPEKDMQIIPGYWADGTDAYECPACGVITNHFDHTPDGTAKCDVCGFVSGTAPRTPHTIFL